jgi:hypothetical protein
MAFTRLSQLRISDSDANLPQGADSPRARQCAVQPGNNQYRSRSRFSAGAVTANHRESALAFSFGKSVEEVRRRVSVGGPELVASALRLQEGPRFF